MVLGCLRDSALVLRICLALSNVCIPLKPKGTNHWPEYALEGEPESQATPSEKANIEGDFLCQ